MVRKKNNPQYKKVGRLYVKVCKCGKEILGNWFNASRKYCSISCREKYCPPRSGWVRNLTEEQRQHWLNIPSHRGLITHSAEFFEEFDSTYRLMMPEIVGLMMRLQRYKNGRLHTNK